MLMLCDVTNVTKLTQCYCVNGQVGITYLKPQDANDQVHHQVKKNQRQQLI